MRKVLLFAALCGLCELSSVDLYQVSAMSGNNRETRYNNQNNRQINRGQQRQNATRNRNRNQNRRRNNQRAQNRGFQNDQMMHD